MTPEDEEQLQHRWEAEDEERAWEAEHADHIEHERNNGAAARLASYRETVGRQL